MTRLRTEAANTARRQAHTRRIGGQQSIDNQNRRLLAIADLMPFGRVGPQAPPITPAPAPIAPTTRAPAPPPPPAPPPTPPSPTAPPIPAAQPAPVIVQTNGALRRIGTVGVFGGNPNLVNSPVNHQRRLMQELLFGSETMRYLGVWLTDDRQYYATVGNEARGFFCGGGKGSRVIDIHNHTRKTLRRASVLLPIEQFGATGGIQNAQKGVMVGGGPNRTSSGRDLQRVVFTDPIGVARIANFLPSPRTSPHNGLCDPTYGYAYSGGSAGLTGAPLTSIAEVSHLTWPETVTTLGVTLSTNFHVTHAVFGHAAVGFVAAGSNANPVTSNWFSNMITRFPYATKTPAILATTLAEPKAGADGTGDNLAGYTVGGHVGSIGNPTRTIDRLSYAPTPEINRRVAVLLMVPQENQGSVSDYGPGFSR
ncbi:MAG: hypothetical protein SNJ81_14390 [Cyanobacteriota bacterium]